MARLEGWTYRKLQPITAQGSIAGTIAVTNESNAVVGTDTFFLQWGFGDKIQLPDDNWYIVASITDNTHLTISVNYPGSDASGEIYDMRLINYQMKLLVGESAGASGEDVDCNSHVLPSFNDLRFTNSDGQTLLDYWIESISGTTPNQLATVQIEFDSIDTGATTFYMYYGKADAAAGSNGANTFILFDDFDDSSVNGTLWDSIIVGTGVITESGTVIRCDPAGTGINAGAKVLSDILFSNNNRLKIKVRFEGALVNRNYPVCGLLDGSVEDGTGFIDAFILRWDGAQHYCTTRKDGGTILATIVGSYITADGSTWNLIDLKYLNQNCIMDINGTDRAIHTTANQVPTTDPMHITIGSVNHSSISPSAEKWIEVDWVFLARYLATGPAWGSWGAEEEEEFPPSGTSLVIWID